MSLETRSKEHKDYLALFTDGLTCKTSIKITYAVYKPETHKKKHGY